MCIRESVVNAKAAMRQHRVVNFLWLPQFPWLLSSFICQLPVIFRHVFFLLLFCHSFCQFYATFHLAVAVVAAVGRNLFANDFLYVFRSLFLFLLD